MKKEEEDPTHLGTKT